MKLLSNEVIMKYDYAKSKMNVEGYIRDFEEDYYKYVNLLPQVFLHTYVKLKLSLQET